MTITTVIIISALSLWLLCLKFMHQKLFLCQKTVCIWCRQLLCSFDTSLIFCSEFEMLLTQNFHLEGFCQATGHDAVPHPASSGVWVCVCVYTRVSVCVCLFCIVDLLCVLSCLSTSAHIPGWFVCVLICVPGKWVCILYMLVNVCTRRTLTLSMSMTPPIRGSQWDTEGLTITVPVRHNTTVVDVPKQGNTGNGPDDWWADLTVLT